MESYELKVIENPCTTFAIPQSLSVFNELEVKQFVKTFEAMVLQHSQDDSAWETSSQCKHTGRSARGKNLPASGLSGRKQ